MGALEEQDCEYKGGLTKKLLPVLLVVFVAGCATTTVGRSYFEPPAPSGGQALVYLMRGSGGIGKGWATLFSINGHQVVSLLDTGYTYLYLAPGLYTIWAGTRLDHHELTLNVAIGPAQTYYIEYTQQSAEQTIFGIKVHNVLRNLDPSVGQALVQNDFYKKAEQPNRSVVSQP